MTQASRQIVVGHGSSSVRDDERPTDRLLTARELAERWGLSADTILDRWQAGEIPGVRLFGKKGGPVRFRLAEIEALEKSWHTAA